MSDRNMHTCEKSAVSMPHQDNCTFPDNPCTCICNECRKEQRDAEFIKAFPHYHETHLEAIVRKSVEAPAPAQPTQLKGKPPQSANLAKCGKCGKEWDDAAQSSVCPHPLKSEDIEKWVNLANQNALEREAWADRYDKLHIALCQACECMNQGDFATAHRIIREA